MNGISLEQAVKLIDSGAIVQLDWVTFSAARKTGGEIRSAELVSVKNHDELPDITKLKRGIPEKKTKRQFVRRFYECIEGIPTSAIRTVHIPLILRINNQNVLV